MKPITDQNGLRDWIPYPQLQRRSVLMWLVDTWHTWRERGPNQVTTMQVNRWRRDE